MSKKASVPSPAQQRDLIRACLEHNRLKIADTHYIISARWFNKWKNYVKFNEQKSADGEDEGEGKKEDAPGPIDNVVILKDPAFNAKGNEPVIKAKTTEGVDFFVLPHKAWTQLHKWYGGGPELAREVIGDGKDGKTLKVEVFPLALTCKNTNVEGHVNPFSAIEIVVSRKATVGYLKTFVCKKMDLDPAHTRVWNYIKNTGKLIREENVTLEEAKLVDGQNLLIEVRLEDGSWPRDNAKRRKVSVKEKLLEGRRGGSLMLQSTFNNMKALLGMADEYQPSARYQPVGRRNSTSGASGGRGEYSGGEVKAKAGTSKGVCGLINLGNTCFLNSAIQCLSNTVPLTEFFLSDAYKSDINKSNPLGMKGQLAECYGALMKRQWSGEFSAIAPRNLKRCIGKYAPQFNGYSQHDAQEFLAFLLDGLHEDLNRVLDKPYVEIKESDGRADDEVSREAWENHLKRNRSVIVDLFQGQLKSTVMCPEAKCGKVSITFDPFMYISLPMPPETDRLVEIILIPKDPHKKPMMYSVKCAKSARVQFLKEKLEECTELSRNKIALVEIEDHSLNGFISDTRSVATFRSNATIFAFETPGRVDPKQVLRIQVLHRRVNPSFLNSPKASDPALNPRKVPRQAFGMPFVLYISAKRTTAKQLYTMIWHQISRFMKQDITRPRDKNDYRYSSEATSMEESIESNASTHTPRQEQNTGEDGPQPMKNKPTDESSKNELSKRTEGENDQPPKQDSHPEEAVATSVEDNAVRKAKEVHQEGQHAPSENGTTSGESIISKEKEESRDSLAVPAVESNGKSPAKKALSSKTSSTSSSTSSSSFGAESGESFTPFEWPPHFDFTLNWEKLPFRLSYSTQNGASCGKCSYTSSCTGCPIKPDDEIVRFKQTNVPTIAIDWDPKLLREFLSVEQAQEVEEHESVAINKQKSKKRLCLDDCFKVFCMNEQLGENDQWYCPNCKDFRQARKKFELWKMPQILVIHLKRFQYTRFSRDKIITFCDFPLTGLDLSDYVQGSSECPIYDLYAVANHQGGLGGGHYTAFGLNCKDNQWYHFNDGSTTPVSEDAVRTSAAYVLFYRRRDGETSKKSGGKKSSKGGSSKSSESLDATVQASSGEAEPLVVKEGKGKEIEGKEEKRKKAKKASTGSDKRRTSSESERTKNSSSAEKHTDKRNDGSRSSEKSGASEPKLHLESNGHSISDESAAVVVSKEKNSSRTVSVDMVAVVDEQSHHHHQLLGSSSSSSSKQKTDLASNGSAHRSLDSSSSATRKSKRTDKDDEKKKRKKEKKDAEKKDKKDKHKRSASQSSRKEKAAA